jgi:hypothetical protein
MTIKILSAIALVTAALSNPTFAQGNDAAPSHKHAHAHHYRNSYNQVQEPANAALHLREDTERGYDPSRIGDLDPDFNPSN